MGAGRDDGRKGRRDEGLGSELAVFPCLVSVEMRGTEKLRSPQEAQSSQAGLLGVCLGIREIVIDGVVQEEASEGQPGADKALS